MLQKGDRAPAFSLYATPDQHFALDELKGKNVILAFYPADWSPVCSDQMALYNEMLKYFSKHDAAIRKRWTGTSHQNILEPFLPK